MTHVGIVLAAILLVAPASWAAEPGATTTTTRPERRGYGGRTGEPANLPTGLPGFGTPGPPPPPEQEKTPKGPAHEP